MQAERRCRSEPRSRRGFTHPYEITGIDRKGWNWQVPLVKCNSISCEYDGQDAQPFCEYGMVAVAPSSPRDVGGAVRARDFRDWIWERYPLLATNRTDNYGGALPFDFELVQIFESPQDMDRYVTSSDYGKSGSPKVAMGIVWQGNDPKSYVYSLRQNSTNYNSPEESSFVAWTTPDTKRLFKQYARTDFDVCIPLAGAPRLGLLGWSCTGQYVYNGVLTFQRLVGDFILSRTGAVAMGYGVAENGVQFVQFPTDPFTESGFYATIQGKVFLTHWM